jgi:molybdopterin converting factor small subunit
MRITIRFFAQARVAAGCDQVVVEMNPPATPGQAILAAVGQQGEPLARFLFGPAGQELRPSILLALGSQQVSWDSSTPLEDGACLTILPPIAGGQTSESNHGPQH